MLHNCWWGLSLITNGCRITVEVESQMDTDRQTDSLDKLFNLIIQLSHGNGPKFALSVHMRHPLSSEKEDPPLPPLPPHPLMTRKESEIMNHE